MYDLIIKPYPNTTQTQTVYPNMREHWLVIRKRDMVETYQHLMNTGHIAFLTSHYSSFALMMSVYITRDDLDRENVLNTPSQQHATNALYNTLRHSQ